MIPEEIHYILSSEADIIPSSGFTQSLMEAIHREAQVPETIAFPWKRALPGIIASCFVLFFVITVYSVQKPTPGSSLAIRSIVSVWRGGLNWLTLTVSASIGALLFTRRLISH